RDLVAQPRLAAAPRAGQSHKPVITQALADLGHFAVTPDETGQLSRKVMRANSFRGKKRRELVADLRVAQLHHAFGARQITYRMSTPIGQPRIGGATPADLRSS